MQVRFLLSRFGRHRTFAFICVRGPEGWLCEAKLTSSRHGAKCDDGDYKQSAGIRDSRERPAATGCSSMVSAGTPHSRRLQVRILPSRFGS